MRTRRKPSVCGRAVVCYYHKSLGIFVKSSRGKQPRPHVLFFYKLKNRRSVAVVRRAYIALRLVQHYVNKFGDVKHFSVQADLRRSRYLRLA